MTGFSLSLTTVPSLWWCDSSRWLVGGTPSNRMSDGGAVRAEAVGAAAPVDDLGFVDLVAGVVGGGEARRVADGAVDVDHATARAADEVVVVVADPVLVPRRRPGRLDAPQQPGVGERAEGVVHRLARDGADLGADDPVDVVGGAVRPFGHGPQDGQALSGDPHAVAAQALGFVDR